ncbi:polysaccharide deacetylase [Coriobacterium glomerans PW2]|uniref:Polysaccharide deacetylase n=1 Tax=Coriobacterium glomerans (strain ATCC 49209 / DSM 20642 / JCM 10262 / PW2) TaxID=700015 RepID=F2NBL3_CORGP|nr:immunoglobulin-like domain-containing protein [Coriobacterium glomerans]AEB06749.1 polysaccharide deacetylase [Coriobacterium glomerans PW2]
MSAKRQKSDKKPGKKSSKNSDKNAKKDAKKDSKRKAEKTTSKKAEKKTAKKPDVKAKKRKERKPEERRTPEPRPEVRTPRHTTAKRIESYHAQCKRSVPMKPRSIPPAVKPAQRSTYFDLEPQKGPRVRQRVGFRSAVIAIVAVIAFAAVAYGIFNVFRTVSNNGGETSAQTSGSQAAAAPSSPDAPDTSAKGSGDIVIGVNGDEDTYVLKDEKYLEAGAHASEPEDGILNDKIKCDGSVDTSVVGEYRITYRVKDSQEHEARATRNVHVVDSMDTMKEGVPILMYHYIYSQDDPPQDSQAENEESNYLPDTKLEEQLKYLHDNDYYYPSYPEVKAFIEGTHSLPKKSVVMTFDDGEKGFLDIGIPLLEKYKVPATSFIIASDSDAEQKVVDHSSPYVSFQSHSYDMHKAGGNVGHNGIISALEKDQIVEDLKHAQEILGTTEAFAYPFGDVTDAGRDAVREAGILCGFTTKNDWAYKNDDTTALPRVRISDKTSIDSFKYVVNES